MYPQMAGHLARFKRLHPAIEIEVNLTNTLLNLSQQDADIAIRPSNNPPENLVGQRVAGLAVAAYSLDDFTGKTPTLKSLVQHPWIGLGPALQGSPASKWVERHVPKSNLFLTVDTFPGIRNALKGGGCIGIMPTILGDADPDLKRIDFPLDELMTSVWVLTHPEIRTAAKIRAFMDFMTTALRKDRPFLEGRERR